MGHAVRHEQDVASLESHLACALDLVLPRALEHIDDLFTRMRVQRERHARVEIDAHLDRFASGNAEVVSLKLSAGDALLLR